ncbi:FAD-dependent oxidoreductase [Roseomonas sp. OT10]|uniref:FAD-dependent oxidoreductase n=1 Tax=Roseomonas cutis TaxID=2897332 RepID=UPI001E49598D|nr:FAD-dependent oxidoreductase [Roseomonas sp. OT10]UFN47903.1 FAD-dependent oxidoreductase [Roseomonas sp. OT10]
MMAQRLRHEEYDVVVVGGGCAGVAAAISAAKSGAKTLLIEAGSMIGGELITGLPVDGALNARGEWIVGGSMKEILDEHERLGGYIGPIKDWRLIWYVCIDPEIMKIAVSNVVRRHGVDVWMYSFAEDVVTNRGEVTGVVVLNKRQRTLVSAKVFIDCSGDGDVAMMAGAETMVSNEMGEFQPLTMLFRISGVRTEPLLRFCVEHPENLAVGESEWMGAELSPRECAERLYEQGQPAVFIKGQGPLIQDGVRSGALKYETALIGIIPVSKERGEVSVNTTRIANIDATDTVKLSEAFGSLVDQAWSCISFMRGHIPGFEEAHFSGLAHRVGIRETRRVRGEYVLTGDDVLHARKRPEDGIGKGSHHIDIHQDGFKQVRIPVRGGGSYDMPYEMLIPVGVKNVFAAGRCMSADREGHGSARVMGPCMAQGDAAGLAASMSLHLNDPGNVRGVPVGRLRDGLRRQGAILEGTH